MTPEIARRAMEAWERAHAGADLDGIDNRHRAIVRCHLARRIVAAHVTKLQEAQATAADATDRLVAAETEVNFWIELQAALLLDVIRAEANDDTLRAEAERVLSLGE